MYLKNIAIRNIGPVDKLVIDFPFDQNGNPIPVVIVGENGSGKTITQSQIVDALYEIQNKLFDNVAPIRGLDYQYYKVSGPINVKSGEKFGFSLVQFKDEQDTFVDYYDKFGGVTKEDFSSLIPGFSLSPDNKKDGHKNISSISEKAKENLQQKINQGAYFYQPAYRYEELFWRNDGLSEHEKFKVNRNYSGQLGKKLEVISSSKEVKTFLLDLVLGVLINQLNQVDRNKFDMINSTLEKIIQKNNVRLAVGPRGGSRVSIVEEDPNTRSIRQQILPSIDNLSLGQATLLNLFINIILHADSSKKVLADMEGIVVIDEIDVHLHTNLQQQVLPELIKLFPKVQFILTTHSPLFVLGMRSAFDENGFQLRNMPNGEVITTERFSEFEKAYETFKKTEKFENEINNEIEASKKPILFVEGETDIKYIKKSAKLLNKEEVLDKINIHQVGGDKQLTNVYKLYSITKMSDFLPSRVLLLYDCDVSIEELSETRFWKRKIPLIDAHQIKKGIENLFPADTINQAKEHKTAFIDRIEKHSKEIRGARVTEPERFEINKDEKNNLCDWLCENGNQDDFQHFNKIFDIIAETLLSEES